ncbi:PP2C family protein-serine/threonine phosphatase [Nocardioides sp.]|uniref:PP2C family protein-serine/threonine phosphatase n=1 Tax=Nocardioides sp. TaxID=35761 RepID=UPI002BC13B6E|nr:protein phosphatase 2C domain-containing protein [Nocardioides sp.]HSX67375.1 protein phosphatase 2C domain-containing protein [Nocardioides sp.]
MGAASHVGAVRALNEDSCLAGTHLAIVADGMGGHARGDVASRLTIEAFQVLADRSDLTPADVRRALAAANTALLDDTREHPERDGMGTTLTGIALVDHFGSPHWLVFNVGDSRVYRLSDTGLQLLTHDHSEVQELVDAGRLTDAQARVHPLRNIVTRSLGSDPAPEPDVWIFPPNPGDTFLLCSDGLTNELDDAGILALWRDRTTASAESAAGRLVTAAVDAGGRDNVTVVVVRLAGEHTDDGALATTGPRSRFLEENR